MCVFPGNLKVLCKCYFLNKYDSGSELQGPKGHGGGREGLSPAPSGLSPASANPRGAACPQEALWAGPVEVRRMRLRSVNFPDGPEGTGSGRSHQEAGVTSRTASVREVQNGQRQRAEQEGRCPQVGRRRK